MSAASKVAQGASGSPAAGGGFDIVRLLLEGRAFFALVVIVVVFSILSPVYFSTANFLVMASHVAIYGLLAIGK
jgi:erythritol transport system permease protein